MSRLAFAVGLLLGGCSAADRFDGAECFQIDDCGAEGVCFLAQCVDPGFTIGEVAVIAAPPVPSGFLEQQVSERLALASGFQTVTLAPTVTVDGRAVRESSALPGTLVASTAVDPSCDSVLPERPLSYSSSKTGDGYSLQVPGGAYL
ncbi:MAG: hypothetical protein AAFQ82_17360, partial [Myxococcota bacterium]